jgi:hypothetical protein
MIDFGLILPRIARIITNLIGGNSCNSWQKINPTQCQAPVALFLRNETLSP